MGDALLHKVPGAIHLALTWKLAQRDKVQPSVCGYCECENHYKSMQILSIHKATVH